MAPLLLRSLAADRPGRFSSQPFAIVVGDATQWQTFPTCFRTLMHGRGEWKEGKYYFIQICNVIKGCC